MIGGWISGRGMGVLRDQIRRGMRKREKSSALLCKVGFIFMCFNKLTSLPEEIVGLKNLNEYFVSYLACRVDED